MAERPLRRDAQAVCNFVHLWLVWRYMLKLYPIARHYGIPI
jgi:hypothetical protein